MPEHLPAPGARDHDVDGTDFGVALRPDYDDDPERWSSWRPGQDVHEVVGPLLEGPVLDVGCGDGRLAGAVRDEVAWIGVDRSSTQLSAAGVHGPVVLADMRALPFRDGSFATATHLWCLYHLDDPVAAVAEARRVLRDGGRYVACTGARSSDPELVPEGYPPTSFDAEDAVDVVRQVFANVTADRWDGLRYSLERREEVEAYCRHHFVPAERAAEVEVPLGLTKRGVLLRAVNGA